MTTPDFPAFAPLFALQLPQLRTATQAARHQFQALFEAWMPHYRLPQQEEGPHSPNRCWNLALTFWTFRWQIAQAGASGREASDQARNLCQVQKRPLPPDKTSPYCQARGQLPLERLDDIHQALLTELQARSQHQRQELLDELFRGIAADLLPDRPGRREPRAVKRRPKPYPRLMCHRSKFKEIQHQNRYYKSSPYGEKPRKSPRA
jgi:hypothetical protein